MKTLKVITASVVLAAASAASADWYGPYGYTPYPAPALTEDQIKQMQDNAQAQREAFEKAQQEAFERHQEAMKNWQAQAPAFERPEFFAEEPAFETPEWVKAIEAQEETFLSEMPAFGEMPEFEAPAFADEQAFETPEWVKKLDEEADARMKDVASFDDVPEMPAFGEIPEFEAPSFDVPDLQEMEQSREQWLKESDERRAQWLKESDERREASKKRHEEFMKKFNRVSTEEAEEEVAAEKQS